MPVGFANVCDGELILSIDGVEVAHFPANKKGCLKAGAFMRDHECEWFYSSSVEYLPIPPKVITRSTRTRSLIPLEADRSFHAKPIAPQPARRGIGLLLFPSKTVPSSPDSKPGQLASSSTAAWASWTAWSRSRKASPRSDSRQFSERCS